MKKNFNKERGYLSHKTEIENGRIEFWRCYRDRDDP